MIKRGRENWENTNMFQKKVDEIKKMLTDKYALSILNEKSWLKRLLLKIKLQIEIRKKIEELSSLRNLHLSKH